jgi:hypothetical protein
MEPLMLNILGIMLNTTVRTMVSITGIMLSIKDIMLSTTLIWATLNIQTKLTLVAFL